MRKKTVVAHSDARDHYQLALALAEHGYLDSLVTDLYTPDWLYSLAPKRFLKRYQPGLSSKFIHYSATTFWLGIQNVLQKATFDHRKKDEALSLRAYSIAQKHQLHLFLYSYYASPAFTKAKKEYFQQACLLFQLHPHPMSVRKQLQMELDKYPQAAASLMAETEMKYSSTYLQSLSQEPELADAIVVASTYTKETLIENNIPANIIKVVPYGVNTEAFSTRHKEPNNKKLRVLFIGSMVQRKGLTYLFEAINLLPKQSTELILCGRGFIDHPLLKAFQSPDIETKINLNSTALLHEMHQADVFVLPSLSEGFGHVILETMAAGLPIIATNHTSAPDLITEGKEGWIIPVRNTAALAERLHWCIEHKTELFYMGQEAAKKAKQFTWDHFRNGIVQFYENHTT